MSISQSRTLALQLLESAALVEPFFRDEHGNIFMKFDRVDVDLGTQRLVFYWQGQMTVSQPLEGVATPGNIVSLGGIEGKTKISIA
jgi:hypothetical protein